MKHIAYFGGEAILLLFFFFFGVTARLARPVETFVTSYNKATRLRILLLYRYWRFWMDSVNRGQFIVAALRKEDSCSSVNIPKE
jgi:hypothetical protein